MSDKVRGVVVIDYDDSDVEEIVDDTNPTHLLVPVARMRELPGPDGQSVCYITPIFEAIACPTCGGSGDHLGDGFQPQSLDYEPCPSCAGRGWLIGGGDGR